MRIITGTAKGIILETRDGEAVRPTTEKMKEAMFSAIQFDIEGRSVLDLFAGSGQLGIESLSRGAAKATFVDISEESLTVVRRNLEKSHLSSCAVCKKSDYSSFLLKNSEKFDIAFLDPPFSAVILIDAAEKLIPHMNECSIIICEYPESVEMPDAIKSFKQIKQYKTGKNRFSIFRNTIQG